MIHNAYKISEIARRYYEKVTGERLDKQQAINRWRGLRNPDRKIIKQIINEVSAEAKRELAE